MATSYRPVNEQLVANYLNAAISYLKSKHADNKIKAKGKP